MGAIQTQRAYLMDANPTDNALCAEALLELAQEGLTLDTFGAINWQGTHLYYIPDEPASPARGEPTLELTPDQIMPTSGEPYEAWLAKLTLNEIGAWAEAHHDLPCPSDILGIISRR